MEAELDASSAAADPDDYDEGVTFEEVEKYSEWTAGLYPVMASRGRYERGYSGLYDNTPDQQPIIDELSGYGYRGVHCLVGLSGHGFKLCPEFGRLMASLVIDGRVHRLRCFRLWAEPFQFGKAPEEQVRHLDRRVTTGSSAALLFSGLPRRPGAVAMQRDNWTET